MTASAWDVAGAVVWPIVSLSGYATSRAMKPLGQAPFAALLILAMWIGGALGTVFCIARLCGAHA